jgi:hypothetical protein
LALEGILLSKKIKYDILEKKLKPLIPKNKEAVNIFIDVYSVLNNLYQPQIIEIFNTLQVDEKFMISAELLNLVSHYRHYFYSRHNQMYTNIYYYFPTKSSRLCKIDPSYRNEFYDKRLSSNPSYLSLNTIMKKNLEIVKIVSEYLPHVYCIDTSDIDTNIVPYHILQTSTEKDTFSIFMSNDIVHLQNVIYEKQSIGILNKGDKSEFLLEDDLIKHLIEDKNSMPGIIPEFVPHILSLSGNKKYSIKGLKLTGYKKAVKLIQGWLQGNNLSNMRYDDHENFISDIEKSKTVLSEEQKNIIRNNLKLFHLPTIHSSFKKSDFVKIENQIINRVDWKSLRYLNDKYYKKYPLDLIWMVEGEEYY